MDRRKLTLLTAFVIATLCTPGAFAQAVAANISVVSGNGQMIKTTSCFAGGCFTYFYPMVVKVTDANGNPIAGKIVTWNLTAANGASATFDGSSTTNSAGLAVSTLHAAIQQGGTAILPFLQSVISATADSVSVSFTETQALGDITFGTQIVFDNLVTPQGTLFSGPAGSTSANPIQVLITAYSKPVPNVNVRLLSSDPTTVPSASCATGPGADPGSVLTDSTGTATCFPVFGPIPGSGPISVLVGGLDPAEFDQSITIQPLNQPVAFNEHFNAFQLSVSPVTPGLVSIVNGNNQTINPGAGSAPLVVRVTDGTGNVPLAGQSIKWTVSPAGAATVSPTSSTTNAAGQTQATVTLYGSASGQIAVKATLASNGNVSATFTVVTNVQVASVTKVSGDLQSTQAGQGFGAPLVVQVNGTNGQPLPNQSVGFQLTGGAATLSAVSALTDGNGQARITVTAGGTSGTVTIVASVGGASQSFSLTVIPPGPALTTNSFYNPGGISGRISALSPCSVVTVLASGLAPNLQGLVYNTNAFGPWATTLGNDTVTVNNVAAPIYSVGRANTGEQLTFQVPCETAVAASVPVTINVGGGTASVNMPVVAAGPGILETVMSDGSARAVAIRPDGTFVSIQNPARGNEVVRVFVTGLGAAVPALASGSLPVPGADSLVTGQVIVGVNNAGARVVSARVSPDLIGIYEVSFQVPSNAPTGNDVVLSVAINATSDSQTRFSNGSKLPIAQ